MLEQSSIVSLVATGLSAVAVIYTTVVINRENIKNLKSSLIEFKADIRSDIEKEKKHAMELAHQRITSIEKDVDEIFPRLRTAEDLGNKNCHVLTKLLTEHDRLICLKEGLKEGLHKIT
jgi:hypothetical protein